LQSEDLMAIFLDRPFSVVYEVAAADDLKALRRFDRRRILDEVDEMLTAHPNEPSHRRKLLVPASLPWEGIGPVWQLRIGDFRVFYDVDQAARQVVIRAVRHKGSKTTKEIL
jgi:mRNA-degrading endonuclease RelE of RelBE toxin-antitoxin system